MKVKNRAQIVTPLVKGQVFKMENNYLQVVGLGKRLMHYKLSSSLKQKGVPTRLGVIEEVENYLKTHNAKLVKN
jgi:hypothetical protein